MCVFSWAFYCSFHQQFSCFIQVIFPHRKLYFRIIDTVSVLAWLHSVLLILSMLTNYFKSFVRYVWISPVFWDLRHTLWTTSLRTSHHPRMSPYTLFSVCELFLTSHYLQYRSAFFLDVIAVTALVIYAIRVVLGYKQTWDRYQVSCY